jgi:hypothetical protein
MPNKYNSPQKSGRRAPAAHAAVPQAAMPEKAGFTSPAMPGKTQPRDRCAGVKCCPCNVKEMGLS